MKLLRTDVAAEPALALASAESPPVPPDVGVGGGGCRRAGSLDTQQQQRKGEGLFAHPLQRPHLLASPAITGPSQHGPSPGVDMVAFLSWRK